MNCTERFLTTLDHREPDRVPLVFGVGTPRFNESWMALHEENISADDVVLFCGRDLTMAKQMGFDAAWAWAPGARIIAPDLNRFRGRLPELKTTQFITADGRIHEKGLIGGRQHDWYVGPALTDLTLWLDWFEACKLEPAPPGVVHDVNKQYKAVIGGPNGGLFPLVVMDSVLEVIVESLGFGAFAKACRKQKTLLERAFDKIIEIRMVQIQAYIDASIRVVVIADDSAYKDRTYIPPALHSELVIPRYRKIAERLHRAGIKCLLHSDGFTEPYFPGFIDAGIDGIVTIEMGAGMDVGRLKKLYGERLSLIAPVDCSRLLSFGTPAEVEREVRNLVMQGAPGGGFAMGPCTSLLDTIPLRNAEMLVEATLKYGRYPIRPA
nr:uroporphyrinogen decarboxylase family protein [Candidatus Sigynarchaeota archaeon]